MLEAGVDTQVARFPHRGNSRESHDAAALEALSMLPTTSLWESRATHGRSFHSESGRCTQQTNV